MVLTNVYLLIVLASLHLGSGEPIPHNARNDYACVCRKTKVAVLGAGMAGIVAAVGVSSMMM
jgi:hypothetical protein